ncbi:Glutamate synthase [Paenibacillus alvei]|uniref:Glutamate synthase n=1 Tax=Paenibacillus alvei TaxID=44250 RepID=A0A383RAR9_PAEAL|nr:Glutamate synthase [Paenibacillus alvei]
MFFAGEYTCKSLYIKDLGDKVSINRLNRGTKLVRQNNQNWREFNRQKRNKISGILD